MPRIEHGLDKATGLSRDDLLFKSLREARNGRIAATDFKLMDDYPLTEVERKALVAYRAALRDLPSQPGAPWDGGGDQTPWPVL